MMTTDEILAAYNRLVNDAMMTLDLNPYWCFTTPACLAACKMNCADGTEVEVSLFIDEDINTEEEREYIRCRLGDNFVEFPIQEKVPNIFWFDEVCDTDARENALLDLSELLEKDKNQLEQLMIKEGICVQDRIIFTDKGLEKTMKISASSTLAVYGEVLHGVKALDKYCKHQMEDSSPFILKRSFTMVRNGNEESGNDTRRCCNYLLCSSKEEVEHWMKAFVSLQHASVVEPNKMYVPEGFPPMICHGEGLRYMVVCYETME